MGKRRPVAWAWAVVKCDGFDEFLCDGVEGAARHA